MTRNTNFIEEGKENNKLYIVNSNLNNSDNSNAIANG